MRPVGLATLRRRSVLGVPTFLGRPERRVQASAAELVAKRVEPRVVPRLSGCSGLCLWVHVRESGSGSPSTAGGATKPVGYTVNSHLACLSRPSSSQFGVA